MPFVRLDEACLQEGSDKAASLRASLRARRTQLTRRCDSCAIEERRVLESPRCSNEKSRLKGSVRVLARRVICTNDSLFLMPT